MIETNWFLLLILQVWETCSNYWFFSILEYFYLTLSKYDFKLPLSFLGLSLDSSLTFLVTFIVFIEVKSFIIESTLSHSISGSYVDIISDFTGRSFDIVEPLNLKSCSEIRGSWKRLVLMFRYLLSYIKFSLIGYSAATCFYSENLLFLNVFDDFIWAL